MINFYLIGYKFEYEVRNVYRIFDLNAPIKIIYKNDNKNIFEDKSNSCINIVSELICKKDEYICITKLYKNSVNTITKEISSKNIILEKYDDKKLQKTVVKKSLYNIFKIYFNIESEYGFLTGIRPNKIVISAKENGFSDSQINEILDNTYEVSREKINLLLDIYNMQKKYINTDCNLSNYNLYIGVPFCPTKCTYCSFVSYVKYDIDEVNNYVKNLLYDIEETIKIAIKNDLIINTIYFGGGTPSVLSCENINDIFKIIYKYYSYTEINEITFEAGRPDTIDINLLECLKNNHVNRISINPQSMNNKTLKNVGRNHTVDDIINIYHMARKFNFNSINMDLIIGLPDEDITMVEHSIKEIIKLKPENITVHALSYKRGAKLTKTSKTLDKDYNLLEKMYNITKKECLNNNYVPYYMYRQKNIKGNLENVGYCLKDKENIYNIVIIEEIETILACGVGAVSKILLGKNRHERVKNYKSLYDYNINVSKNINDKIKILNLKNK